jgi:hypothetical protein
MIHRTSSLALALVCAIAAVATASPATAVADPVDKTLCVFDPSGAHGDIYKFAESYQAASLAWGVRWKLKPYTNEVVATQDFKAGQCQSVLLTSLRSRAFIKATGTLEAIGALPSYGMLKSVIGALASPKAVKLVTSGEYETMGILPGGAVYLLLRDRSLNTMAKLAGKRIATLTHDQPARTMVDVVGASMVPAEVGTFAGIFNNGRADACYSPATAVKPLELAKGMGSKGGIVRYPLAQLTFQLVARSKDLPDGFGQKSREWTAGQFEVGLKMARAAEAAIPKALWIDIDDASKPGYEAKFRDVRVALRNKGVYHGSVLKLMKRVRCRGNSAAECSDKQE